MAIYLPTVVDVRLMEGADVRRMQLVRDALEVNDAVGSLDAALREKGWKSGESM
jgi:hypothetical protein